MMKHTIPILCTAFSVLVTAFNVPNSIIKCPITIDGRIPFNTPLTAFDQGLLPYNANYSKGFNLTWSQIIQYPSTSPSKFDLPTSKPLEVTINNSSIFLSGGTSFQYGFRRAGLLLGNGTDATNVGVKTFHWSVKQDDKKKMNLTHEYMNTWHERNDYSGNQFSLNAGIMLAQDEPSGNATADVGMSKNLWKVLNRNDEVVWTGEINWDEWQNFAVKLDYNEDTLQVFYSEGYNKLEAVTEALSNDNSGGGQFQIGILKKPTDTTTVVYDGYQEGKFYEGQIYGGIFIEDSAGGCISV